MTRQRNDNHSTEFGLWLREQAEIDSKLGFIATNVDYVWHNYKTGDWMLLEEKRHNGGVARWQRELFDLLDGVCKTHPKYRGFFVIRFEHTSPADGKIFINGNVVTCEDFLRFLRFEYAPSVEEKPPF